MVRRISELEALRGLMALWVMLGHIYLTFPLEGFGLIGRALRNNGMAVDVFIILSGFVIFNLLDRERGGYLPYIVRRLFRIYPVYFVLGGASYFLWKHQAAMAGLSAAAAAASIAAVVALTLMLCPLPVAIWTAVLGVLLLHALNPSYLPSALLVRCLRNSAMTWLGTISYSLYLVHMIPLIIALKIMPEGFKENGLYQPYLFAAVTVSSLLLSWCAYHAVERPGISAGKLVAARWQRKSSASTEAA